MQSSSWLVLSFISLFSISSAEHICIELTARFETAAPDGVQKQIITINGQFPGPTIRARRDDTLTIRVHNRLVDSNGVRHPTSVHFHGIEMFYTPWFDGPEQVAQCPIPYNSYMDYTFTLYQTGTYWYHSHHSWQYVDGFWGLLIVDNSPSEVHQYDDELFLTLMDWHHRSGEELSSLIHLPRHPNHTEAGHLPVPDSALINGRGNANCTLARKLNHECDDTVTNTATVFDVIPGKTYRIRVLNPSARAAFNFSIDGHVLRTIETDGVDTVEVEPVDVVTIWPAQRYSFLVTMNASWVAGNAWIRAEMLPESVIVERNDTRTITNIRPLAVLHYLGSGSDIPQMGNGTKMQIEDSRAYDRILSERVGSAGGGLQGRPANHMISWSALMKTQGLGDNTDSTNGAIKADPSCNFTEPIENSDKSQKRVNREYLYVASSPNPRPRLLDQRYCTAVSNSAPSTYDEEVVLNATFHVDEFGFFRSYMNNVSYTTEGSQVPAVFRVMMDQPIPESFVPITLSRLHRTVQVVINNMNDGPHPWHLHGHTFYVVGTGEEGDGAYDSVRDASKLTNSGVRRDTTDTPANSWTVVRFRTDNPGVWLLHCHIHWHLEIGLGAVFIEGPNELRSLFRIPQEARRVCRRNGVIIE